MDKATPTLRQRGNTALQSLPDAPYRAMLAALFDEMLAEVERLAAQSASAPAVRMLTPEEEHALCIEHGATVSAHLLQAIQRKFCAVNAGKRIPADGKIGGV